MGKEEERWDDTKKQFRPVHKGRIRTLSSNINIKGDKVEIWQGGRLIGYEYTKPDKKNCWLEGIK